MTQGAIELTLMLVNAACIVINLINFFYLRNLLREYELRVELMRKYEFEPTGCDGKPVP